MTERLRQEQQQPGARGVCVPWLGRFGDSIAEEPLEEATMQLCRGRQSYRNTMAALGDAERPFDSIDGKGRDINSIPLN